MQLGRPQVAFALVLLLALPAYLTTLAPTITRSHWGIDTAELAVSVFREAVPHPSGYPLYLLLGKLFLLLPFGDVAHRLNLMSATFAASAAGLVSWAIFLTLSRSGQRPSMSLLGAVAGGLTLAYSFTFWSQAVIAEVYALHTFILALLVVVLVHWRERLGTPAEMRLLGLVVLILALGLGNHLTIALVAPGLALFVGMVYWQRGPCSLRGMDKRRLLRHGALLLCVFGLGLTPYLVLVLWSRLGHWPSLWDPSTPEFLVDHILGGPFKGILFSFSFFQVLSRLSGAARFTLEEFTVLGVALSMAGLRTIARSDRPLLVFWLVTAGLNLVFALNYPTFDSRVYLLPFYLLLSVAMGWGAAAALAFVADLQSRRRVAVGRAMWSTLALALGSTFLLVGMIPAYNYVVSRPKVDLTGELAAYTYAEETIEFLPQDSLLLTWGGAETFPLWYLQYVEERRPDVMLVDAILWGWTSYQRSLARRYGDDVPPVGTTKYVEALLARQRGRRQVFATTTVASQLCQLRTEPVTGNQGAYPPPVRVIDATGRCG